MGRIVYECCMREVYGPVGWPAWDFIGPEAQGWYSRIGAAVQYEMGKHCLQERT